LRQDIFYPRAKVKAEIINSLKSKRMNTCKFKIIMAAIVVAMIAPVSVRAQEAKTLYILKNNAVVYSSPVSEIDSIIFYDPESTVTPSGFSIGTVKSSLGGTLTFMAYNLGANPEYDTPEKQMAYLSPAGATGVTDSVVYGGLFQWGRPADGHQLRTSATTTNSVSVAPPGHGDFILGNYTTPYDWLQPQDHGLWNVVKTAHDPCPEGWRIPTLEEWQSIFDEASGNTISWNENGTKGIKFSPDGETYTLFLPAAGSREPVAGSLIEASVNSIYWSSTVTTKTSSYSVKITGGPAYSFPKEYRYWGFSCRCVKEYD
jgi:uncharacterized protein (TIGR02145 family)